MERQVPLHTPPARESPHHVPPTPAPCTVLHPAAPLLDAAQVDVIVISGNAGPTSLRRLQLRLPWDRWSRNGSSRCTQTILGTWQPRRPRHRRPPSRPSRRSSSPSEGRPSSLRWVSISSPLISQPLPSRKQTPLCSERRLLLNPTLYRPAPAHSSARLSAQRNSVASPAGAQASPRDNNTTVGLIRSMTNALGNARTPGRIYDGAAIHELQVCT